MRLIYCNLGSHAIFVPILTALASILISTTAGVGIERDTEKDQDYDKDKDTEK